MKLMLSISALIVISVLSNESMAQQTGCSEISSETVQLAVNLHTETQAPLQSRKSEGQDTERRGCCSHHGGVCGCNDGRALCCDGQASPTCGCD